MSWLRRFRGALGLALVWGVVWAAVGALKGLVNPDGSMDALWLGPAIGAFPGFVGGLIFSALLAIAAAPRRLHELSVLQVGAWGGMVGAFLGFLPFGINKPPSEYPVWMVAGVVMGSMALMGVVSAAGALALARRVKGRALDIVDPTAANESHDGGELPRRR